MEFILGVGILHGIIIPLPVADTVVGAEVNPRFLTGQGQFTDDVVMGAGCGGHGVVGVAAGPETEAVVMPGGEHDVPHTGVLRRIHPVLGVEEYGIELPVELVVLILGDEFAPGPGQLFTPEGHRPPVDEHAEAIILEPFQGPGICMQIGVGLPAAPVYHRRSSHSSKSSRFVSLL